MARGGRRSGAPGASYPNRTDLGASTAQPLPIQTAAGQAYGAAKTQSDAQRAIPMAPPPPPAAPQAPPTLPSGAPITSPPVNQPPGGRGDPLRPTERPNEPVTAGLPTGPGAGPEALSTGPQAPPTNTPQTGRDFFVGLAAQPGAPTAIRNLAALAQHTA